MANDLEANTYILKNILASELDPTSARDRHWAKQLACVSPAEARFSVRLVKAIGKLLPSRPIVLLSPRASVALYTEKQLHRLGVEKLAVLGAFQYYAMAKLPERLLFRKKKATSGKPDENATTIFDLREGWLELLPYEARFLNGKLVIRAAAFLEHLRLNVEKDILRIGNEEAWKRASKKQKKTAVLTKAKLEYSPIYAYDRVKTIDLLRKHFLELTPKAEYQFHQSDGHVKEATRTNLHPLILGVSKANRYKFFPLNSKKVAPASKEKSLLEKEAGIIKD